jgi:hypothetical protein
MRIINTKLFTIIYNLPLIGALFTLIFIVPIMNNKEKFSEQARQGILMQFFAPGVYVMGRLFSYSIWFFFGWLTLEKIISWISLAWLLLCYGYMIFGAISIMLGKDFEYKLFKKLLKLIEYFLWH